MGYYPAVSEISIHALLTESDIACLTVLQSSEISIHALLTESDSPCPMFQADPTYFYPRSPYGERHHMPPVHVQLSTFLSTLSLRRATVRKAGHHIHRCISIHALLTESDLAMYNQLLLLKIFLSTLSLRRATAPNRRPYR